MALLNRRVTAVLLSWIKVVVSTLSNKNVFLTDANGKDIADYIASNKYVPNERELPRLPLIKNIDNDATYLLSRLSDEELLNLLNDQPQRKDFSLSDLVKIALNIKTNQENILQYPKRNTPFKANSLNVNNRLRIAYNGEEEPAYFRLNHKHVDHTGQNDVNYEALQKLKSLLNANQETKTDEIHNGNIEEKKELLFDVLTAQLKSLCCKKNEKKNKSKGQNNGFINKFMPSSLDYKINPSNKEYMFLIMNDEIKWNDSDELLTVDPASLGGNSSVLLLGPVTTPLSDDQLKLVMKSISNELVKPEYHSLLKQLSNKMLIGNNRNIIKSFVLGSETRRYIKPHRCNHQSKLAKVYGGSKWLICTGYLNLNKPSLYD